MGFSNLNESGKNVMQPEQNTKSEQISFLMSALDEAQSGIRAFDTRAQIGRKKLILAIND